MLRRAIAVHRRGNIQTFLLAMTGIQLVFCTVLVAALLVPLVVAYDNGVARLPPMGCVGFVQQVLRQWSLFLCVLSK